MKTIKTFEDYLQDIHAEQYQGLDDNMPDDFNSWLTELDSSDMIEFADLWAKTKEYDAVNECYLQCLAAECGEGECGEAIRIKFPKYVKQFKE